MQYHIARGVYKKVSVLSVALAFLFSILSGTVLPLALSFTANASGTPDIIKVDSYYVKSKYKGVSTDITVDGLTDVSNVEVKVNRSGGADPIIKTSKASVNTSLSTGALETTTAPIIVQHGTYNEAGSGSWNPAPAWASASTPVSVEVTITYDGGETLTKTDDTISETKALLSEVIPSTPVVDNAYFALFGDGFDVGFNVSDFISNPSVNSLKIELYKNDTLLANAQATPALFTNFLNDGTNALSKKFNVPGPQADSSNWDLDNNFIWTAATQPTKVVITLIGANGTATTTVNGYSTATPGAIYESLLPPDTTEPTATLTFTGGKVVDGVRYVRPGDTLKYTVVANDNDSGLDRASHIVFKLKSNGKTQDGIVCGSWHNGKFPAGSNTLTGSFTMKGCNSGNTPTDRLYGLGFRVYDNANNNLRIPNAVFAVDGTKPVVSDFDAPDLVSKTLDVSLKASDATSGVEYARVYLAEVQNGVCKNNYSAIPGYLNTISHQASGEYNTSIDTSALNGEYCVLASARDNATNNSTPLFKKIRIDNTGPTTPVIENPLDGEYFTTNNILNKWSASTDESGVKEYQVAYRYADGHTFGNSTCPGEIIDGQAVSGCRTETNTQRNHKPHAVNEQGGVTIWVRALDNLGNYSDWSESVSYYYDGTDPLVAINSPASGSTFGGTTHPTINFTATDPNIESWTLSGPGLNATGNTGGTFNQNWDVTGLNGTQTITLTVRDKAGNESTATLQINIDNTINITSNIGDDAILDGTETISANLGEPGTISFTFFDEDDEEITVTGNTTSSAPGQSSFTFDTRQLENGDYAITITGTDALGNTTTRTIAFSVFNAPQQASRAAGLLGGGLTTLVATFAAQFNTNNPQVLGLTLDNTAANANNAQANQSQGNVKSTSIDKGQKEKELAEEASSTFAWYWILLLIAVAVALYYAYRNWKLSKEKA